MCITREPRSFRGISVIAAVALSILLVHVWPVGRRLLRAAGVAVLSSIPVVLWFVRNASVAGQASEKEPVWHPPGARHLRQAAETLGGWVQPFSPAALVVGITVAICATVAVVFLIRLLYRRGAAGLPGACLLFVLVYLAFLLLSRAVLDQNIPFDARLLSPVQTLSVIGLCSALGSPGRSGRPALGGVPVGRARAGSGRARHNHDRRFLRHQRRCLLRGRVARLRDAGSCRIPSTRHDRHHQRPRSRSGCGTTGYHS